MKTSRVTDQDELRLMPVRLSRRYLLSGMVALGMLASIPAGPAKANSIVSGSPLPIAIPNFFAGAPTDGEVSVGMTQIITENLKSSGLFTAIDQATYIEKLADLDVVPQFNSWKSINAQALVTGRMTSQADGRMKIEFRLWEVATGLQLMGHQYWAQPESWRRVADIISDQIYERLSGEKGYFEK